MTANSKSLTCPALSTTIADFESGIQVCLVGVQAGGSGHSPPGFLVAGIQWPTYLALAFEATVSASTHGSRCARLFRMEDRDQPSDQPSDSEMQGHYDQLLK
jgi:hypothetical protein